MSAETTAPEFSRDLARLMLMMRRLVKEEFTVTVHLADPEAAEELLAFASRSRNSLLRQMARELESRQPSAGPAQPAPAAPTPAPAAQRTYRGAAVPGPATPARESPAPVRRMIYRGQVISAEPEPA